MVGRRILKVSGLLLALGALVWADLARRAYTALNEGERYLAWHDKPELQKDYWDSWLKAEETRLEAEAASGRITARERVWRVAAAKAEHQERLAESPLKYAVRWFETAAELFTPPPTPWSRRARERLEVARLLWSRELAASGLKLEDYSYR